MSGRENSTKTIRPTVFVLEARAKAALPALESLTRGGLRVAAGSDVRWNCGFFSRYCRERHIYPSPRFEKPEFQRWLLSFLSRRKIEMLFPLGHYGALAVSEIQQEIRERTLLYGPDHGTFMAGYAKIDTMKAARAADVPIPDSWFPQDYANGIEDVVPLISRWPVLVKPSIGVGSRGINWCHSAAELRRCFSETTSEYGECFVQDFVPPGGMQYKVDMLVDERQRRIGEIVYGKSRMYPPDGGSSVLNFSADRPDILDSAHRTLCHMKWTGFCDFDFVVDPRDDVAKLMEINPRFPESFRMGTSCGVDFPMLMYRLAHGESVEPVAGSVPNRFLRFLPGDLMWYLRVDKDQRRAADPSWFAFSDRRITYQICNRRDPGALIGYLLENLAMIASPQSLRERFRRKPSRRGAP